MNSLRTMLSRLLAGSGEPVDDEYARLIELHPESGTLLDRLVALDRANTELIAVRNLMLAISEKQRALRHRSPNDYLANPGAFQRVNDPAAADLTKLGELRARAYGKVIVLRNVASKDVVEYRLTQVNYGFPKEAAVIPRLGDVAKILVSAERGDEVELPKGTFEVIGVAGLERYIDPQLADNLENFRLLSLTHESLKTDAHLGDLADELHHGLEQLGALRAGPSDWQFSPIEEPVREVLAGDRERLGTRFYLRTTKAQEALMTRPGEGLAVVLGVAGSGKTSVALGRAKVLCDRTEEQGGDPEHFRPESAIGFVLSNHLRAYLELTCNSLALYNMPVWEFRELRENLLRTRSLDAPPFVRSPGAVLPAEGRVSWLGAVDQELASYFANALVDAVSQPPSEQSHSRRVVALRTPEQVEALGRLWQSMRNDLGVITQWLTTRTERRAFQLLGLNAQIDAARADFTAALEREPSWHGVAHRELRQNVRSALRERLVRALRLPEAYAAVIGRESFAARLRAVGAAPNDEDISTAQRYLAGRELCDSSIDLLLAIAHVMAIGYRGRQDRDPISHLTESGYYSQVFIDEFQDFSEVQLFLMGAQANPTHRAITIAGDFCQQLSTQAGVDIAACFPGSASDEVEPVMLIENKRQTPVLALLAHRFRRAVLGDNIPDAGTSVTPNHSSGAPARVRVASADGVDEVVVEEILRLPRDASVAVICPDSDTAQSLERRLRGSLGSQFRETRFSQRADLIQRFYVHFTTALDAKGLEFDATVVPFVERYRLNEPAEANRLYVAITRPRTLLTLVATEASVVALRAVLDGITSFE